MLGRRPKSLVGLDIGSSVVKAVELRQSGAGYKVVAVGAQPMPPDSIVGGVIMDGGIFESERSSSDNRVPGLHRIPLLGWLFKSESERESTEELLIFLTPRVVR